MNDDTTTEKAELLRYMTRIRRDLHAMPELSSEEYRTSEYIAERLDELGLSYRKAHTGLIADIKGREGRATVAFRADFDALPVTERTGLPFAATCGRMHACGHDGHTAMLLGAAKYLSCHVPRNNVRLVFQFGEEGDGGAVTMIEGGALEDVDAIFAFHLCPELEKGRVGTNRATLFAGVAEFDVAFEGVSSHCAVREEGKDALAAGVYVASRMERCVTGRPNTLLHVGKMTGGSARNIVARDARLECSFRFFSESDRDPVLDGVRELVDEADRTFGTRGETVVRSVYPPLVNDPRAVDVLESVTPLTEMPGRYTAEDFAFYLRKVPGAMAWLGIRDALHTSPLHSDTFDFDENVLSVGTDIFIRLAETQELPKWQKK